MKFKHLFGGLLMAATLALGVGAGISSLKKERVETVEAAGTIDAGGKTLISLKNSGWTEANAWTAVYFWNASGNAWSGKYVAQYPVYDSGNSIYIIDVPEGNWTNYKCVRVNPSNHPTTPNATCWNDGIKWGETSNFTFGSKNTLEPVINGGYNYDTAWKLEAGTQVYLDLNGNDWTSDNRIVCAYLWGNTSGGSETKIAMHNVHGWDNGNVNLYELTIPGSGYWGNIIFYRSTSVTGGWDNQTADLTGSDSNNVFKLTSYTAGSWNWNFAEASRAEAYGTYFLSQITCSGSGSITSPASNWTNVKNEYDALNATIQGIVWSSSGAETGTDLVKAMYRYDYIVLYKQYSGYNDFINRKDAPNPAFSGVTINNPLFGENGVINNNAIWISIVSVVAVGAVAAFFILKKKRA